MFNEETKEMTTDLSDTDVQWDYTEFYAFIWSIIKEVKMSAGGVKGFCMKCDVIQHLWTFGNVQRGRQTIQVYAARYTYSCCSEKRTFLINVFHLMLL